MRGKRRAMADQGADRRDSVGAEIDGDAAGNDRVHHQAMPESGLGGAQRALAHRPAMGVHQRERGVVADRADVAEMVGEPLQFGHQRAQPAARGGGVDPERASTARAKAKG